ncbi:MAG: glutamate 5-kinase [Ruminococcaceae bacterium]|nr:glutamate 5-kinase [Oscillospiraceae bacterium]
MEHTNKLTVVKVGTSTLTHDTGKLNLKLIDELAKTLSDIHNRGDHVVLVTSGAIGVGLSKLGISERPTELPKKQAAAAVGQSELMFIYDKFFSEYGQITAQVLLTREDIDNEKRCENVKNTFHHLLSMGVIPIVNENDTVATDEIEFGDNDTLAAVVASLCGADLVILLTDIDGLYDGNPKTNPEAKRIAMVTEINDEIKGFAGQAGTNRGTGGMITKLSAAEIAMKNGIDMVIAAGNDPVLLYDIVDGKPVGTRFKGVGKSYTTY